MSRGVFAFRPAALRERAVGEIHARPYALISVPRVIFQLAFLTDSGPEQDHDIVKRLSQSSGSPPPSHETNHHAISWGQGTLRWERHTEFSTYFWDSPAPEKFGAEIPVHPFGDGFSQPGPFISGIRLEIRPDTEETQKDLAVFDRTSLCRSDLRSGEATILTDFRPDGDGLTKILVIDRGLSDSSRGALVQKLLDIETYRTLAMMALPLAQSLSPEIRRIEASLTAVTQRMKQHARDEADPLLAEITRLAAELEANAAMSLYRFGASRAYYEIVQERIRALAETATSGSESLGAFLERRLAPAMRTCQSIEERQANLSRKLARATSLLRSWIDVELERINMTLLNSMDRRAKMQLRLQQTVEGLSVAAISYYVVGLIGYVAKGVHLFGIEFGSEIVTAISVPVVVLGISLVVRNIRHGHLEEDDTR
ncbi:Uncharacterized membrane-anchored protein [Rhizobium mongolense subsp. loessense]|uniref:Uncharacterized membrane-anchored protein n=1 Tax=Rhizobium mongolense subsp. loessense TaxID=158890 RepID=A0A1G4TV02_9HYPH|nr:DUF3422 family protein [Rhizobium mongolense]SCW84555.1 Uncharacterized membrane-anchored protein [Rhizobium mongolense subsp. loessense]